MCGPSGIRTHGLLNAIETRSQLRYGPMNFPTETHFTCKLCFRQHPSDLDFNQRILVFDFSIILPGSILLCQFLFHNFTTQADTLFVRLNQGAYLAFRLNQTNMAQQFLPYFRQMCLLDNVVDGVQHSQ